MAQHQHDVTRRLQVGVVLVIGSMAAIAVADLAMYFAIQAEINLVARYGFGHVPRGLLAPYVSMGKAAPVVGLLLSLLKTCGFAYFLYQTAKAMDLLGIRHRFSKILTGLSIFIPFVSFYLPWAALGEARQTFKQGPMPGIQPTQSVRSFDLASFGLGFAWIVYSITDLSLGAVDRSGKIVDLSTFTTRLSTAQSVAIVEIVLNVALSLVFVVYARTLMRFYRSALVRAVGDVFAVPADGETPAPPVLPDPIGRDGLRP